MKRLQICKRELTPEKYEAKLKKITKKRPLFAKVPFMIAIGMKIEAVPGKRNPEWEEVCATACAVQNIYLMATAQGLGGGSLILPFTYVCLQAVVPLQVLCSASVMPATLQHSLSSSTYLRLPGADYTVSCCQPEMRRRQAMGLRPNAHALPHVLRAQQATGAHGRNRPGRRQTSSAS